MLYRWIHRVWYGDGKGGGLLLPLSWLFWLVMAVRRALYRTAVLKSEGVSVPVIVVGNITAGGTGKTPVTVWLVQQLAARGHRPGIVSRGYGGDATTQPQQVSPDGDARRFGDEPVLMARRAGCPVIVCRDRVAAARRLQAIGVDVILADDGLQHYRLQRDYEICVIDGVRHLGNRRLLPAGPLREVPRRLLSVDQVLVNGGSAAAFATGAEATALDFELVADRAVALSDGHERALGEFAARRVHGVAGIGNPERFFATLRSHALDVIEHPLPDHDAAPPVDFGDGLDVLLTEKDAVKVDGAPDRVFYVPVSLRMDEQLAAAWLEQLEARLFGEQVQ